MIEADFPSTLPAFLDRFGDEGRCRDYLARQKWPDGFRCRTCTADRAHYLPSRKTFECAACGHQESLIAGTMFEQTKKPLREWFLAIFYVTASKGGVSAAELQRLLGMGSYQGAREVPVSPVARKGVPMTNALIGGPPQIYKNLKMEYLPTVVK